MVIDKATWEDIQQKLEKHNRESCDRFWNSLVKTAEDGGYITKEWADIIRAKEEA